MKKILNIWVEENSFTTSLEPSVFQSHFFKNTWVGASSLEYNKFITLLKELLKKDLDQDKSAQMMDAVLIHNIKKNKIYLLKIDKFLELSEDERVYLYKNFVDFYIPRTIWYKSFCLLEKELPEKFKI
jgi:hypothetical protein